MGSRSTLPEVSIRPQRVACPDATDWIRCGLGRWSGQGLAKLRTIFLRT